MRRYISVVLLLSLASVNCSNLKIGGRIVGGKPVNIKNFSYQAGVYYNGEINCGGTIISLRKILTAAHCTNGRLNPVSSFTVRTGSSILNQGDIHQVQRIKQHPNFDAENFLNDISILFLTAQIRLTFNQWPIQLAIVQRPPVNTLVVVSGWGRTSEDGGVSTQLLATNLNTISQENCIATYRPSLGDGVIVNTTLCAAAMDKDACQGDSGGPLVNVLTRRLVGVVSWGIGCATKYPGVYTLVPSYRSFIKSM